MTQSLSKPYRDASYDPKKGWDTTAQPYSKLTMNDYCRIATLAQNNLKQKAVQFLNRHGFSYIEVSHEEFAAYEKGDKNFREWLDSTCKQRRISSKADFLFVTPRVKTEKSGQIKMVMDNKEPDRIVDYIGVMFVALKKHPQAPKNKDSVDTLIKGINAIENDAETLARKNHYWEPHPKTKFRGHYSLWSVETEIIDLEDKVYADYEILAEAKMEHESQMDADKLTRRFLSIGRASVDAQTEFSKKAQSNPKTNSKKANDEKSKNEGITALGAMIYNRVFTDAGLVKLMDPKLHGTFSAMSAKAILASAKQTVKEHFTAHGARSLMSTINNMSMFDEIRKQSRASPKARKN